MKRINISTVIAISLVLLAAVARVANAGMHIYNFAPVAAVGLFSGAVIKDNKWMAILTPLMGQFLADVFFQFVAGIQGFYPGMQFTYAALAGAAWLGTSMKQAKPLSILGYTLGASAIFFVVSNLGYFTAGYNGYTINGLVKTYIDAIPFYRNALIGDMLGSTALFSSFFLAQRYVAANMKKAEA